MARTQPIDFEEYTVSHSTASSIQLSLRTIDWHSKDSYHRFANENLSIDLTLWKLSTNVLSRASRAEIGGRRDCFGLRDNTTTSRPKRFGLEPDPLWHVTRLCPGGRCWTRQESAKFQDADRTLHSKTSKEDLTAVIQYRISLLSITTSKPGVNWTFNKELHFSLPVKIDRTWNENETRLTVIRNIQLSLQIISTLLLVKNDALSLFDVSLCFDSFIAAKILRSPKTPQSNEHKAPDHQPLNAVSSLFRTLKKANHKHVYTCMSMFCDYKSHTCHVWMAPSHDSELQCWPFCNSPPSAHPARQEQLASYFSSPANEDPC